MPELITTDEGFDAPPPVSVEFEPSATEKVKLTKEDAAALTVDLAPESAAQPEIIPQPVVEKEAPADEPLPDGLKETFQLLEKLRDDIDRTPAMEKHKPEFKALTLRFERVKLAFHRLQQGTLPVPTLTADDWEIHRKGVRARIKRLVPRVLRK